MINKKFLLNEYLINCKSAKEIALNLGCSESKINYWLNKFKIKKRNISDAIYVKNNADGDPFNNKIKLNVDNQNFIAGLGLGLFWGEGNKKNKSSVRLGNTDPSLVNAFINFLEKIYKINRNNLQFGIQIFSDMNIENVRSYWVEKLNINPRQIFPKITVTKSGKIGTYKEKTKYGVITVYFHNTKLKAIIDKQIEDLRKMY